MEERKVSNIIQWLQWQPVKLWWTPCRRGLRQCWKIMVATQNIDTLGPIWTFSLRGVLTFVASGLDINGCWVILMGQQMYTVIQAVHSLLYIVAKCHFFSVVTWKYIIKYLQKWGVYSLLCDTVINKFRVYTHSIAFLWHYLQAVSLTSWNSDWAITWDVILFLSTPDDRSCLFAVVTK